MSNWEETELWQYIANAAGDHEAIKRTLQNSFPKIQTVLAGASTELPDFTMHDHNHGFRVAQRAANLVLSKIGDRLNPLEASLLLLASYLHDIGMTPQRKIVQSHFKYILTGDTSDLSRDDLDEFQKWLDVERGGIRVPVDSKELTSEGLRLSEDLLSYYCRHRHNDWSEDWIRSELNDVGPGLYPGWIADLIILCRSHHDGITELRRNRFDARIVGSSGVVLNLRYLAALLRVADVLEFDAERTPEIILRHRNIAAKSRIYWHKDHAIGFSLEANGSRMIFSARTPNSTIHKAVLDTAAYVDAELATCSTLSHEGAFHKGAIADEARKRYQWVWPARLTLDIREDEDKFVYIDGAFRPDSNRIINLLSGVSLYRDKLAAVRELIQNAVDAVCEQIAYERLMYDDALDSEADMARRKTHRIKISVEKDGEGLWLVCADDGVGMNKDIIENHLLVSGSSIRPETRRLERSSEERGFSVGRTGQFGIGVLSYFMMADAVSIVTRRSNESGGDPDATGWSFSIGQLGGFGELRKENIAARGTEVRLKIKSEFSADTFASDVFEYVNKCCLWTPCSIEFKDKVVGAASKTSAIGWTATTGKLLKDFVSDIYDPGYQSAELMTAVEKEKREQLRAFRDNLLNEAEGRIAEYESIEVSFGDRGWARIKLPYFKIGSSASLAFFDLSKGKIRRGPEADFYLSDGIIRLSWRGFSVEGSNYRRSFRDAYGCVVELNLVRDAAITVDRTSLDILPSVEREISSIIRKAIEELYEKFLNEFASSKFSTLNEIVAYYRGMRRMGRSHLNDELHWQDLTAGGLKWAAIKKPCAIFFTSSYESDMSFFDGDVSYSGKRCLILTKLNFRRFDRGSIGQLLSGGRLVLGRQKTLSRLVPGLLWDGKIDIKKNSTRDPRAVLFPPEFILLAGVIADGRAMVNSEHEVADFAPNDYLYIYGPATPSKNIIVDAASSKQSARNFISEHLGLPATTWKALADNYPNEIRQMFTAAETRSPVHVIDAREPYEPILISLCESGVDIVRFNWADEAIGKIKLSFPKEPGWYVDLPLPKYLRGFD